MHARGAAALFFTIVTAASPFSEARADVYISEFLALNSTSITDEDGDHSDWIEIYNGNPAPVDLGGWYLTDDAALLTKWQFPSTVVPAGDYVVVFASDKNRATSGAELHTTFKLGGGGEYLGLIRSDGVTIEHEYAPAFPAQTADVSWGMSSDFTQERCFFDTTPGGGNDDNPACGVVDPIAFSVERGFFSTPFNVTMSTSTPDAAIYYTLDGTVPSPTHGATYSDPISVTTTTTLRAVAVASGFSPTPPVTHTYLFLADVVRQTGAGFPTEGFAADYAMDAKVVDDPRYSSTILDDLRAVPTISIVMDVADLFGKELGIYTHPEKRGVAWERPASAELILPNGSTGFEINAGVRIQGRLSRVKNPKKSLRLAFKSEYGPPVLDYPLLPDTPVTRFNKLRLRASHNKSWSFGIDRADYIRDQWVRDTQIDMGQVASHGAFFHVYLNGLYWGLYNVVELPEAEFAASYYGGLEEEWDVIEPTEVEDGTRDAWDAAHAIARAGVASPTGYASLRQYVDVDNLIDYMLVNFHAGTVDWDEANWYAARRRVPGEGFKFFSWDAEQSMEFVNAKRTGINNPDSPSALYAALRANQEFRLLFADHVQRHFFRDGALVPKMAAERYMERAAEIDRAIVAESARWGDTSKPLDPFDRDTNWVPEIEWLRLAYFPRRSAILLDQLRDIDLYPAVEAPSLNVPGRFYAAGASLTLSAPAGAIYFTLDGSDPRLVGGAVAPTAVTSTSAIALSGAVHIKARARVDTTWSALSEAMLVPEVSLRVTELMFHPAAPPPASPYDDEDFEFIEIANVGETAINLAGIRFSEGIDFELAGGVLAAGARALLVRNQAAFESRYGTGLPVLGEYSGKLANEGERIRIETDDGEVLDFVYEDTWYPAADGAGPSLVIVDAAAERKMWSRAGGWQASFAGDGSPGAPEPLRCTDGIDNDEDGAVDLLDVDCESGLDDDEASPPIDAFVCYSVRPEQEIRGTSVSVTDEVDTSRSFTLDGTQSICLPGVVDSDTVVVDPDIHLQGFGLRSADGATSLERRSLLVEGLGPIYLDTFQPDRLLAPAALGVGGPPAPPSDASHALDYYKCHRVKAAADSPRYFPRQLKLRARNEFEEREYDFRRPSRLCNPASVDGRAFKAATRSLLCYQARRSRGMPQHDPRLGLQVASPLGTARLATREVAEICVPVR